LTKYLISGRTMHKFLDATYEEATMQASRFVKRNRQTTKVFDLEAEIIVATYWHDGIRFVPDWEEST